MGDNLPTVDLGLTPAAKAIAVGGQFTCAIRADDVVKCWGHNTDGQLGQADTLSRGRTPREMGEGLGIIDLGGVRRARLVACGGFHSCAILDDGSIKCWGGNFRGQLGLGDQKNRGDDAFQMGDFLPTVPLVF
jgi:alpha-tubulin suppressor-like RCC1 family protein